MIAHDNHKTAIRQRTTASGVSLSVHWGITWFPSTARRLQASSFLRFALAFWSFHSSQHHSHVYPLMHKVWNEPNDQFWRGGEEFGPPGYTKQTSYFELYKEAALALKAASPKLQVGGPATCCADCWIEDFVKFMDNSSTPYDFISTHAYSSCQMPHLGDVEYVVNAIAKGRSDLNNATSGNSPNHPAGKTPPWLITEFGASCNQGFGNPDSPFFPSAIHDMIDQSSYTIATVDQLAGPGEPQALSYVLIMLRLHFFLSGTLLVMTSDVTYLHIFILHSAYTYVL